MLLTCDGLTPEVVVSRQNATDARNALVMLVAAEAGLAVFGVLVCNCGNELVAGRGGGS